MIHMSMQSFPRIAAAAAALAASTAIPAQSNQVTGRDATLRIVDTFRSYGREGTYPDGNNAFANGVTVCNVGVGDIGWYAPMNADHPVYAPMVFRVVDDRIEQLSGRSYVKHGFASINGSVCGTCGTSNGAILGPNCSDTYGSGLNADRYWLGPPEEIDPWTGGWNPQGSLFDRGLPDVGFPQNQDGASSLTRTMSDALPTTKHRVEVSDQELLTAGARFYYGMYVVIAGEPGANRDNNWCFREFRPVWNGASWNATDLTNPSNGSPLSFWPGARVTSASNGGDDGYFYVASKITGPDARGFWHYEYAIQNRDNHRGGAEFRIPMCPSARIENLRFGDLDSSTVNDWAPSRPTGELVLTTPSTLNTLDWNTIFNVSFDVDVGPVSGSFQITQARTGPGAMSVAVPAQVPGIQFSTHLGEACGATGPSLRPTGTPPFPVLPNPSFGLAVDGASPAASLVLLGAIRRLETPLGSGCSLWLDPAVANTLVTTTADAAGHARIGLPIPLQPALEGADLTFQVVTPQAGGAAFGVADLSNGLEIRLGNRTSGCR